MAGRSTPVLEEKPKFAPLVLGNARGEFLGYLAVDNLEDMRKAELLDLQQDIKEHLKRGNEELQVELGVIIDKLGNNAKAAKQELTTAVNKLPLNAQARYSLARLLMHQRDTAKKEWSVIVTHLRESIKIDKDNIPAHYYLGSAIEKLVADESYQEAIDAYLHYLKYNAPLGFTEEVKAFIDKRNPAKQREVAFQKGEEAFAIGDYAQSAVAFLNAAELGHLQAFYRLGEAYEADGAYAKAVDAYLAVAVYGAPNIARQAAQDLGRAGIKMYTQLETLDQGMGSLHHLLSTSENHKVAVEERKKIERTIALGKQITTSIQAIKPHESKVTALAFHPGKQELLSGAADGVVKKWDVEQGLVLSTMSTGGFGAVAQIIFAPGGKTFVVLTKEDVGTAIKSSIKVYHYATGVLQFSFEKTAALTEVLDLKFTDGGKSLSLVTFDKVKVTYVWKIWRLDEQRSIRAAVLPIRRLPKLNIFSPSGHSLLTLSNDSKLTLWTMAQDGAVKSQELNSYAGGINNIAYFLDGTSILVGASDGTVQSRNLNEPRGDFQEVLKQQRSLEKLAFSPDGKFILTSAQEIATNLWQFDSGAKLQTYITDHQRVSSIAFSAAGTQLALGLENAAVLIFSVASGNLVQRLPFVGFPAWSPLATLR